LTHLLRLNTNVHQLPLDVGPLKLNPARRFGERCKLVTSSGNNFNDIPEKTVSTLTPKWRKTNAVPTQKYQWERRSHAFPHHYTLQDDYVLLVPGSTLLVADSCRDMAFVVIVSVSVCFDGGYRTVNSTYH